MPRPTQILALDTEDDTNGTVTLINFYDGFQHHTFSGPGLRERAWQFLGTLDRAIVWACNLEYDLINTFGDWLGKLVTLQYVSAGLMRGVYREARVQFFDTLRHWPASVKQMGDAIGLPKLDATYDGSMPWDEMVKYCQRDTEIVWRYVVAMLERYEDLNLNIRPTLPAMALQWFKKQFYTKEFVRLPNAVIDFFREGYYGGRVEVFKLGRTVGPFHHYDVNSLFPSVMAANVFPSLDTWWSTDRPDFQHREGMADVTFEYPYHTVPGLPVRHEREILYPYGRLRGVWPYPEIRQALLDGAKILAVHRAIEFPHVERPFGDYVRTCYQRRLASSSDVDKTFWKLMMNSLYGKFGQSNEGMLTIYDDEEIRPEVTKLSEHVNVVWSAYVTAYARLTLLRYLRSCSVVYYTDTDSLFTPDVLPTGPALGELKYEGEIVEGTFYGNKLYLLGTRDKDGNPIEVAKAKGVKKANAAQYLRTGRAVFRRPARFRESRRSFVTANVWYEVEKAQQTNYTKRRRRRDKSGFTEPWALNEYERKVSEIRIRGGKHGNPRGRHSRTVRAR